MKYWRVILTVIMVALVVLTIPLASCSKDQLPATIKIGALLGLTGNVSYYAESQQRGIDLAASEINNAAFLGEKTEISIIYEDTGATNDGAVAAMQKLLNQKVVSLIGPTLSAQAFAADPLAQQAGVPLLAMSNTIPGITEMGDYIFRCSLPESSVIEGTIKMMAQTQNIKKAAVIWGADEAYTIGGYDAFMVAFSKHGIEVVSDTSYAPGTTDFSIQLQMAIDARPDALCLAVLVEEGVRILQQAQTAGFSGLIISGNGLNTATAIEQGGDAVEGLIVGTAWNKNSVAPANTEFTLAYQQKYGSDPDQFAVQAYTSVFLIAQAIKNAGSTDTIAVRDALAKLTNIDTPLGQFSFSDNREPQHPSAVQQVKNGVFIILD